MNRPKSLILLQKSETSGLNFTMNDSLASKLKQLKADDLLYFIFLVAIVIDIYADDQSRKELYGKNVRDPSALFILAAFLVLFVFIMFAIRNYREMQRFPPGSEDYRLAKTRVIGSLFIVFGQSLVVLYLLKKGNIQQGSV